MSSDGDSNGRTSESATVRKDQMIAFLTQTGKVRPHVASSLYDQGLNDPAMVQSMDRVDFVKYKGVGEKTADALMGLKDIPTPPSAAPDLWEALTNGKVRSNVIQSLKDAALDSPDKIKEAGKNGLMKLKGIGDATADRILEVVKAIPGPVKSSIEDASAVQVPEEPVVQPTQTPKGEGLMDKVAAFFKGLFGKKEPEPEKPKEAAGSAAVPPAETTSDIQTPTAEAPPAQAGVPTPEVSPPQKPPHESEPVASESQQAAPVEPPTPAVSERSTPDAPAEQAAPMESKPPEDVKQEQAAAPSDQPAPAEQPKAGFFDKLFSMFKKPSAPAEPATPPVEVPKEPEKPSGAPEAVPEVRSPPAPSAEAPEHRPAPINSIEEIPGIGPDIAKKIKDAGYQNVDELREAVPEDLTLIQGIDIETARKICAAMYVQA